MKITALPAGSKMFDENDQTIKTSKRQPNDRGHRNPEENAMAHFLFLSCDRLRSRVRLRPLDQLRSEVNGLYHSFSQSKYRWPHSVLQWYSWMNVCCFDYFPDPLEVENDWGNRDGRVDCSRWRKTFVPTENACSEELALYWRCCFACAISTCCRTSFLTFSSCWTKLMDLVNVHTSTATISHGAVTSMLLSVSAGQLSF